MNEISENTVISKTIMQSSLINGVYSEIKKIKDRNELSYVKTVNNWGDFEYHPIISKNCDWKAFQFKSTLFDLSALVTAVIMLFCFRNSDFVIGCLCTICIHQHIIICFIKYLMVSFVSACCGRKARDKQKIYCIQFWELRKKLIGQKERRL